MTDTDRIVRKWRDLEHLRTVAGDVRRRTAELNAAIRQAHEDGCSLREIAAATGLNHQTVANRLKENRP